MTNWDSIEDLYGSDTDDWIGKPVVLYVDPDVRYGAKRTGGLRIKPPPSTEDGAVGDDGSTPF